MALFNPNKPVTYTSNGKSYTTKSRVNFSPLSNHDETAAAQIARLAAAYVYNGFSQSRIERMIFFATLAMRPGDKEKLVTRARALYGSYASQLKPGFQYVTLSPNGGYTYTNNLIAAANSNASFKWVMDEVCNAAAENDAMFGAYDEMVSDFYQER